MGNNPEENNNRELHSDDSESESKSKNSEIPRKKSNSKRSSSQSSSSKQSSSRQSKKQNDFMNESDEIDETEKNKQKNIDLDSINEHINLNYAKQSLEWNNKNKFQNKIIQQSPINNIQFQSNYNLLNTSLQNTSLQNITVIQNTLIPQTINSTQSNIPLKTFNFQTPKNGLYDHTDNFLNEYFNQNYYVSNNNNNPISQSVDDSQKHDNSSEHADAVPNLHQTKDLNSRINGFFTSNSNSPEDQLNAKSFNEIQTIPIVQTNNPLQTETHNQYTSTLNSEIQPKNMAIGVNQIDVDNQNFANNFTKMVNAALQLNGVNIHAEIRNQSQNAVEQKKKVQKSVLNSSNKKSDKNNHPHKESFNNQENFSEDLHNNLLTVQKNGIVRHSMNDLQVIQMNTRKKASSSANSNDNTANQKNMTKGTQKLLNPLHIQIPKRDSQLGVNRNQSQNGSAKKQLGQNNQFVYGLSPSDLNGVNRSILGSVLREQGQPNPNIYQNRSFNIFTSPNQQIQTTINPTHQSFQIHQKSFVQIQGEIIKWKQFSLFPPYPITRPPKLDDKQKINDLFINIDTNNSSLQEYTSNIEFFKALALCHRIKTKKVFEKNQSHVMEDLKDNDNEPIENVKNSPKYKFEPLSKDEQSQLQLSQKSGMEFFRGGVYKSKEFYDLKYKEKIIRYKIKETYFPNPTQQFFGIIVQVDDKHLSTLVPINNLSQFNNTKKNNTANNSANVITQFVECETKDFQLFIKGTAQEILPRCQLPKFQKDHILKDLQSQQSKGMRQIFFAKKNIKESDLKQTDFSELANNLDFLGSICLLQQLIPQTNSLINLFQSAGILNWLVSSDSSNSVLAAAYQSSLISHDATILSLDQTNIEELKYQVIKLLTKLYILIIKNHLFYLQNLILDEDEFMNVQTDGAQKNKEGQQSVRALTKEQYKRRMSNLNNVKKGTQQMNNGGNDQEKLDKMVLLIDGSIFNIILSNDYLKSHFQFMCLICNSVLGYNFGSNSKAKLISLIQETQNSKTTVISFGYGSKDSQMMNQSNFSFMISGQSTCQSQIGDITTKDFSLVKELIFGDSIEVSDKLQYLVVTNTKLIIYIMFLNYFYQLHNYQIQSDLVKGYQITLNIYASQTISSLYIMLSSFAKNPQNCLIKLRPEFYKFRKTQNSWMKSHFIDCMIFAAMHAFLTSLLLENPLMSYNSINGKLMDYEVAQGIISFVMGFSLIFIVMAGPMKHNIIAAGIFVVIQTLISFLPSIFKVFEDTQSQEYIFQDLFTLSQAFSIFFIMIGIFITEYQFTHYFRYYLIPEQFLEVFNIHQFRFNHERIKTFLDKLRSIVYQIRLSPVFLTNILKSLFTKTEIDPFLRKSNLFLYWKQSLIHEIIFLNIL